ncbi:SURF1 family protein [Georgenia alba]|uniref:SURF1-like protein n=1 Tax=Georgenia alba TaxID=2233858 RepID=A0ABW2QEI6_9MICO
MSGRLGFLRTPRWLGLGAAALAFAALCVLLGLWQWSRFEDELAQARQVEAAFDAPAAPLPDVLGTDPMVRPQDEWRRVQVTGRYVPDATLLLRNRPEDGTPAAHLVTPFVADTPQGPLVVVVDRGWLPTETVDAGAVPQAPRAGIALTARLRQAEEPIDRDPPPGQVYTLDPDGVLAAAGVPDLGADAVVLEGYVAATRELPAPGGQFEAAEPLGGYDRPESRWGVNLSYAIQWWLFAVGAPVALVVLARREAAEGEPAPSGRRRPSAEEEEDALIDAQLRRG